MITPTLSSIEKRKEFRQLTQDCAPISAIIEAIETPDDLYSFYSSRCLLTMSNDSREQTLNLILEKFPAKTHRWIVSYLILAFKQQQSYRDRAYELVRQCSATDLLFNAEFKIQQMRNSGKSFNGEDAPADVIESQLGHLQTTLAEAITFVQQERLSFNNSEFARKSNDSLEALFHLTYYVSIKGQINEVLMYSYLPIPFDTLTNSHLVRSPKKIDFFLRRTTDGWREIEIYRDLNYSHLTSQSSSVEDTMRVMEKTKMLSVHEGGQYLHFNFLHSEEFAIEQKFDLIENLLTSIYGSSQSTVLIGDAPLSIAELISAAKKIHILASRIQDRANKNGKKVQKFGEKQLLRALNITCKQEKIAINLFTFEVNKTKGSARFSLLLKSGSIYYLLPSHVLNQSYEKVVDKILSRPDVKFPKKQPAKGSIFENMLKDSIAAAGYEIGSVKRDQVKGVPEIDGILSLSSDSIILYEAKCTIKPEERDDAFTFVENHLAKACDQLFIRKKFLESNPKMVEERVRFPITGRDIICLVVTNHSYFTGMKFSLSDGSTAHVIDQNLLLQILSQKRMPVWSYDDDSLAYVWSEEVLSEVQDLRNAITSPVSYLKSTAKGYIHISDAGCAYEISSAPSIKY